MRASCAARVRAWLAASVLVFVGAGLYAVPGLVAAQDWRDYRDRFELFNECRPIGLLVETTSEDATEIDPEEAAIGRPTPTARRVSPNTRRAYAGALRRLDAWLDGSELDDVAIAAYLAELHDAGRASSSASMAVAAACFRAKLAGQPTPGWRADGPGAGRVPASERGRWFRRSAAFQVDCGSQISLRTQL